MGLAEAESGEVFAVAASSAGGEIWEDDEEAGSVSSDLGFHAEEEADEIGVDGGEVSAALVDSEGGEPFEDGGSRVRVRVRVCEGGGGGEVIEGDVRGERIDDWVDVHGGKREGSQIGRAHV